MKHVTIANDPSLPTPADVRFGKMADGLSRKCPGDLEKFRASPSVLELKEFRAPL